MELTTEQVKGILDRLVAMLLVWLVAKGYLADGDAATVGTVLIGMGSLAWGWWINRRKSIVQAAAAIPNTVVVTQPQIANSTPELNIVSNVSSAVVSR